MCSHLFESLTVSSINTYIWNKTSWPSRGEVTNETHSEESKVTSVKSAASEMWTLSKLALRDAVINASTSSPGTSKKRILMSALGECSQIKFFHFQPLMGEKRFHLFCTLHWNQSPAEKLQDVILLAKLKSLTSGCGSSLWTLLPLPYLIPHLLIWGWMDF